MGFDDLLDQPHEGRHNKYAVVVFLPEYLERTIAPLREKFDPVYNLISPHVSIVHPFESEKPLDELAAIIGSETEDVKVIPIELKSIGDFYPRRPIIYWNVTRNEQLTRLYYRLYSRLGEPIPYKLYMPHVTVAREISDHRVLLVKEKIVNYLPEETFHARAIDLITPLPGSKWVSVRTFPLSDLTDSSPME